MTTTMQAKNLQDGLLAYLDFFTSDEMRQMRRRPDAKYGSCEEFVRAEGQMLNPEPFTPDEEAFLLQIFAGMTRAAKTGACYENATYLVWATEWQSKPGMAIEYGEGYALHTILPVLHAVMLLNGKPVDVTWREDMSKGNWMRSPARLLDRARFCLATVSYYLVAFSPAEMNKVLLSKTTYGLIDNYREGFPLLTNGR